MLATLLFSASTMLMLSPTANATEAHPLDVTRTVDHIVTLIRPENFDSARSTWVEDLGFRASPAIESALGVRNTIIWFPDGTYVELATYTDENEFTAPVVAFLDSHEGAKAYATEVGSIADAADFFDTIDLANTGPFESFPLFVARTGAPLPSPLWSQLSFLGPSAPDDSLFLIDYDEDAMETLFESFPRIAPGPHRNTALRLDAIWLVVDNLEAATDFYTDLGSFVRWRNRWLPDLGVRATNVRDRENDIVLMQAVAPGPIADFAAERGEGIAGIRIEVANLRLARRLIESRTGLSLTPVQGHGERSFRVPTELTQGMILELFQPLARVDPK